MPRAKEFDRNDVLEKAMNLFWERGFHATTMENLVNHLGINRASIYDTYGSKRDLFDKALNKYREQRYTKVASFLNQHADVRQGLYQLFEYLIDSAITEDARGCFLVNATTELAISDIYIQQKLSTNKSVYESLFTKYIEYGKKQGQLSAGKDSKLIASYLYTLKSGIKVTAKLNTPREELMSIVNVGLSILD